MKTFKEVMALPFEETVMEMARRMDKLELAVHAWVKDREEGNNNDDHHDRVFREFLK